MAKPARGYKASTRSKNKDSAQVSDSDDEDYDPTTKAKTIPKVEKKVTVYFMKAGVVFFLFFCFLSSDLLSLFTLMLAQSTRTWKETYNR